MLKDIPPILSPELLKILCEMGHGDELVIADGNFSAKGHPQRVVRLDGHGTAEVLDAVLSLFPLDNLAPTVLLMSTDDGSRSEIWSSYQKLGEKYEKENYKTAEIERFKFYERAKAAYAVVTTSEKALYANIIIKKGVI